MAAFWPSAHVDFWPICDLAQQLPWRLCWVTIGPRTTPSSVRTRRPIQDILQISNTWVLPGPVPLRVTREPPPPVDTKFQRRLFVLEPSPGCDAGPRARVIAMDCSAIALRSILKAIQSPQDSADAPSPALSRRISRCANSPRPKAAKEPSLLIPLDVAHHSGMISPTVPI